MDNVLYTDGHGIKVTTVSFSTGKTTYRIDGILNAYIKLIRAHYTPALLSIFLGFAAILAGVLNLIPDDAVQPFSISGIIMTVHTIAIFIGALLIIMGLIMIVFQQDKYSVHIVTAEGEKDPIVSDKKDYVGQIVSALEYALRLRSGFQLK
jgi:hypothetical protein